MFNLKQFRLIEGQTNPVQEKDTAAKQVVFEQSFENPESTKSLVKMVIEGAIEQLTLTPFRIIYTYQDGLIREELGEFEPLSLEEPFETIVSTQSITINIFTETLLKRTFFGTIDKVSKMCTGQLNIFEGKNRTEFKRTIS